MAPTANPRVLFAKIPGSELPVSGEHIVYDATPTIDLDVDLKGGFLTKTLLLSPEPYMRQRLRDSSVPYYSTPMKLGQPLVSVGLVLVLRSEKDGVSAGDYMVGCTPWEMYTVQPYMDARADFEGFPSYTFDVDSFILQPVPDPKGAFPWTKYCGCLAIPGLTAFAGVERFVDAKAGETIYVSSGASGVGSLVIQLCKNKGLKVIGSASTSEKVEFMRSIGADVAFNYKTTSVASVLSQYGPIDLYFDNVGGQQIEIALDNMNLHGRIISCGAIDEYNVPRDKWYGVKNLNELFNRRIRLEGFNVVDHFDLQTRFLAELPPLIAQGKIKSQEHLFMGLENGTAAFLALFNGTAKGKPVVVVDLQYT